MRCYIGGILAASFCFVALLAAPALAVPIQPDSPAYQLRVATEPMLLEDPNSHMAQMAAVWKTAFELEILRSMPVFLLENTSTGSFDITSLTIDINEPDFVFDTVEILSGPPGFAPIVISPTDTVFGGATSPIAQFSFASRPLGVGETFMFSLRIVPDVGVTPMHTDFREILWGPPGADRNDNALVHVEFDGADLPIAPLFNYPFADEQFVSLSDSTSGESMRFPGMTHYATDVGLYEFDQTSVVPEPNGFLLASICLSALLLFVRRGKPRAAATQS